MCYIVKSYPNLEIVQVVILSIFGYNITCDFFPSLMLKVENALVKTVCWSDGHDVGANPLVTYWGKLISGPKM